MNGFSPLTSMDTTSFTTEGWLQQQLLEFQSKSYRVLRPSFNTVGICARTRNAKLTTVKSKREKRHLCRADKKRLIKLIEKGKRARSAYKEGPQGPVLSK